jgi:hypothetical protein
MITRELVEERAAPSVSGNSYEQDVLITKFGEPQLFLVMILHLAAKEPPPPPPGILNSSTNFLKYGLPQVAGSLIYRHTVKCLFLLDLSFI